MCLDFAVELLASDVSALLGDCRAKRASVTSLPRGLTSSEEAPSTQQCILNCEIRDTRCHS